MPPMSGRATPTVATPRKIGAWPLPGFGYAYTCSVSTPVPPGDVDSTERSIDQPDTEKVGAVMMASARGTSTDISAIAFTVKVLVRRMLYVPVTVLWA